MTEELDIKPHTINLSCGIFGKTDKLPDTNHLEISTMCGHGMIGHRMTSMIIKRLKKDEINLDQAIRTMSRLCTCGIFNPTRARKILIRAIK
ncbi:MAG: hypothetical protein K9L30_06585 [Desulfobacterales bacterium]|nr:hypothetical protein [Desulfobacterales bacterium]